MVEAIFTLGAASLITLLGLLVVYNSARETIRKWFLMFCLALSFWQVMFFLSEMQSNHALLFNRLTFIGPLLAVALFLFFIKQLESDVIKHYAWWRSWDTRTVLLLTVVGVMISLSPWLVASINPRIQGGVLQGYDIYHGSLYFVYNLIFLALVILMVRMLVLIRRTTNVRLRQRTNLIATGVIVGAILGVFTNLILPLLLKSSAYSYLGSLVVLFLAVVLSIAIARHKLINVQLIVARSFAYVASITSIMLIYTLAVVFLIRRVLGSELNIDLVSQLVLGAIFIVGSMSFRPIKVRFDKLTNKLFYRDAYDPQDFIGKLNGIIVSTIDVGPLLTRVGDVIVQNLKAEFCTFEIRETEHMQRRSLGTKRIDFTESELKVLYSTTAQQPKQVIVAEDISDTVPELYRVLKRHDVEVLIRLASAGVAAGSDGVDYAMLGVKKSGNPYNDDDQKALSIIANELAVAIENALQFEQTQQFNETLEERVADATRKLRRSNEKLKAMDETKDDFISMASHQLRTPLTSIKGYVSMVLDGDMGEVNPAQRQALNQALTSSQRMVFLIADLLNLSRLKTGKFIIEPTPTKLADLIESEVNQLQETANARELELIYHKPAHFPVLMLDETKIRQVAMNFMDNAIYYTHAGGHIAVDLRETEKTIEFTVTDDGIGVPKHEQPHLFNKFYRAGNARKARPDGTGLGLFMAKKVIVAQGGSIIFRSKEGKGSTFGFSFAKARLMAPPNANPVFHESNTLAAAEKSLTP